MTYTYRPQGVCSQLMEVEVEDGKVRRVEVVGGCNSRMEGIRCGYKPTSCPDQLAKALKACIAQA